MVSRKPRKTTPTLAAVINTRTLSCGSPIAIGKGGKSALFLADPRPRKFAGVVYAIGERDARESRGKKRKNASAGRRREREREEKGWLELKIGEYKLELGA